MWNSSSGYVAPPIRQAQGTNALTGMPLPNSGQAFTEEQMAAGAGRFAMPDPYANAPRPPAGWSLTNPGGGRSGGGMIGWGGFGGGGGGPMSLEERRSRGMLINAEPSPFNNSEVSKAGQSFGSLNFSGSSFGRNTFGNLPGFAQGGNPDDGLSVVGERGPELLSKNGSQVSVIPLPADLRKTPQADGSPVLELAPNRYGSGRSSLNGDFYADAPRPRTMPEVQSLLDKGLIDGHITPDQHTGASEQLRGGNDPEFVASLASQAWRHNQYMDQHPKDDGGAAAAKARAEMKAGATNPDAPPAPMPAPTIPGSSPPMSSGGPMSLDVPPAPYMSPGADMFAPGAMDITPPSSRPPAFPVSPVPSAPGAPMPAPMAAPAAPQAPAPAPAPPKINLGPGLNPIPANEMAADPMDRMRQYQDTAQFRRKERDFARSEQGMIYGMNHDNAVRQAQVKFNHDVDKLNRAQHIKEQEMEQLATHRQNTEQERNRHNMAIEGAKDMEHRQKAIVEARKWEIENANLEAFQSMGRGLVEKGIMDAKEWQSISGIRDYKALQREIEARTKLYHEAQPPKIMDVPTDRPFMVGHGAHPTVHDLREKPPTESVTTYQFDNKDPNNPKRIGQTTTRRPVDAPAPAGAPVAPANQNSFINSMKK